MAKETKLETRIRQALAKQNAEETYKSVTENPAYKDMIYESILYTSEHLIDGITKIDEDLNEEDIKEMKDELAAEVLPEIKETLENPELLKKIIYESAEKNALSYAKVKKMINEQMEQMRSAGEIEEAVIQNYKKSYSDILKHVRANDKIVKRLVDIAKADGIEKALQKETKYGVIREFFPTAEEYRRHHKKGIEDLNKFFKKVQSVMAMDGEEGKNIGKMFGALENSLNHVIQPTEKSRQEYFEKEIKEIYG
ncbi:MAG TPA: hypothetical protein VJ461_02605 [Candidatus Nanoarchaeia archaeon]|nr:hypothetical protein [Candidatus Nanoarchaeia archaeon]